MECKPLIEFKKFASLGHSTLKMFVYPTLVRSVEIFFFSEKFNLKPNLNFNQILNKSASNCR